MDSNQNDHRSTTDMDSNQNNHRSTTEWITTSQGVEGINYQRAAQITWWSILQGVAVSSLVMKIPDVITKITQQGKWYLILYVVASFLIIVNAWVQMAWVILVARWQLNLVHTTLILLLGTSLSITCSQVDEPRYWLTALSFLIISAISVYIYNLKNHTMDDLIELDSKDIKKNINTFQVISIYVVFLLICAFAIISVFSQNSDLFQAVWGLVFFLLSCIAFRIQHIRMEAERIIRKIL